jgi:hypothetical protein
MEIKLHRWYLQESAPGAQKPNIDFLETDSTCQTDSIAVQYSRIKNDLSSSNRFIFKNNVFFVMSLCLLPFLVVLSIIGLQTVE